MTSITVLTIVALVFLMSTYAKRLQEFDNLRQSVSKLESNGLEALYLQEEFLINERINENYFKTGHSNVLEEHSLHTKNVEKILFTLNREGFTSDAEIQRMIGLVQMQFLALNEEFEKLIELVGKRGFLTYGTEGRMRSYAHILEQEYRNIIPVEKLLMLRRHEKDFIIRKEEKYVSRFDAVYGMIINSISGSNPLNSKALEILGDYHSEFMELVVLERSIGLNNTIGVKPTMNAYSEKFRRSIHELESMVDNELSDRLVEIKVVFVGVGILLVLFWIVIVISISRRITKRIHVLSEGIGQFVQSNFRKSHHFNGTLGNDEIGMLASNFDLMQEEIGVHFKQYQRKVQKRTKELERQKQLLEESKHVIERRNKEVLSSIRYAKRIQDSFLPSPEELQIILGDYFILYKPKDIVSGDFYWVRDYEEYLIVAVGDCTGHGVPGAIMSILSHGLLNQACEEQSIFEPDQILKFVNEGMMSSIDRNRDRMALRDGLDIALVVIDKKNSILSFSGAQRPLFLLREGEEIEMRGDRYPVGGYNNGVQYTNRKLHLQDGDQIYMYSDGYSDQFGGKHGKKMKQSILKRKIQMNNSVSMSEQKVHLERFYKTWKGDEQQIDDVCILGFKFDRLIHCTNSQQEEPSIRNVVLLP